MTWTRFFILLFVALPIWGAMAWYWYTSWKRAKQEAIKERTGSVRVQKAHHVPEIRDSIRCEPEVIRPPPPPKGVCGIPGCKITWRHSHVHDLAERLKTDKR